MGALIALLVYGGGLIVVAVVCGFWEKKIMRTLNEKYNRNKTLALQGDSFAAGYCTGVDLYNEYPRAVNARKTEIKVKIDTARGYCENLDYVPQSDQIYQLNKGIMCGYRDAANTRKGKLVKAGQ